jgi:L-ascorbate metabolism protein UlaG (beta-lactamase superfamily)
MQTVTELASITRIVNPCALIETGGLAILTDPYLVDHRVFPMNESIGLTAQELPQLDAIIGGHGVVDHWDPRSLRGYLHGRTMPVFTATARMARQAQRAGFRNAQVLAWGESVRLGHDTTLTCVAGERVLGGLARTNNYLISSPHLSIFVGTEAQSLGPIRECAQCHDVDVAVLPIDGLTFARKRLVMNAATALEATSILGAGTLAPIHYSQRPVKGLWKCPSGIDDLLDLAANRTTPVIKHGPTGVRVQLG